LAVHTTPANRPDAEPILDVLDRMPAIPGPRGRPRTKPRALLGDRAYGQTWAIALLNLLRIKSLLARPRQPHGSGLGRRRYVVERTLAWFGHFRRIKLCYERIGEHFQAFHDLAASLICARKYQRLISG